MNKNTLLIIGIGAAALYFLTRKKKPKFRLEVESPEKISEDEYGKPTIKEPEVSIPEEKPSLLESVTNIVKTTAQKIKERKETKKIMFIPGTKIPIDQKKFQKAIRQQKKKMRQQKRQESRIRRKKVGEISILY